MIISTDTNPERDLYYLGALVIAILKRSHQKIDFLEALRLLQQQENISVNLFTLTIDWLFLLNIIKLENNFIKRCF